MEENWILRNGREVIPASVFCAVVPKLPYSTVMMAPVIWCGTNFVCPYGSRGMLQ